MSKRVMLKKKKEISIFNLASYSSPTMRRRAELALGEVLECTAQVSKTVFEGGKGQDGGLVGRVKLEHRQNPPAPGRPV